MLELCMEGIRPYIAHLQAYRRQFKLSVGLDTESQLNQECHADLTLKNAAKRTLDELRGSKLQVSPGELMLLRPGDSPGNIKHPAYILLLQLAFQQNITGLVLAGNNTY